MQLTLQEIEQDLDEEWITFPDVLYKTFYGQVWIRHDRKRLLWTPTAYSSNPGQEDRGVWLYYNIYDILGEFESDGLLMKDGLPYDKIKHSHSKDEDFWQGWKEIKRR